MKSIRLRKLAISLSVMTAISLSSTVVQSAAIFADTVIDYFNSGAGPFPTGIYGGSFSGSYPVALPDYSNVLDADIDTFISLPTSSYITLGFSTGFVFDGAGNDIFIAETGSASENADIFVSSNFGASFTYLGNANGGTVTEFDLSSIGYTDNVNAIKVVGLDSLGGSPGFDLAYIEGLEGSAVSTVAEPSSFALLGLGLIGLGAYKRKKA